MDDLHEAAFRSSAYQPQLNELHERLTTLAHAFLDDPLGLPETDLDHKLAQEVAIGMLDRLRHRLTEGEWPS